MPVCLSGLIWPDLLQPYVLQWAAYLSARLMAGHALPHPWQRCDQVMNAVSAVLGPSAAQQRLSVVELAAEGCNACNLAAGCASIVQRGLSR